MEKSTQFAARRQQIAHPASYDEWALITANLGIDEWKSLCNLPLACGKLHLHRFVINWRSHLMGVPCNAIRKNLDSSNSSLTSEPSLSNAIRKNVRLGVDPTHPAPSV